MHTKYSPVQLIGAQTVEAHHMIFSSFSLSCLDCKGGDMHIVLRVREVLVTAYDAF